VAIKSFANKGTEDVFDGHDSKNARRVCPAELLRVARRKLDQLNTVTQLQSLAVPPGNHLEALKDDRKGQHSIRINDQYRVCFVWSDAGATGVEITDYH
jgi:proteic killer suppression protein